MRRPAPIVLAVSAVLALVGVTPPAGAAPVRPAPPAEDGGRATSAAPTCTPNAPTVVGAAGDQLTISVPGCNVEAGLTGYRIAVLATAAETQTAIDVPIGTTQRAVTGLTAGTLYRFRVAARNADGVGPYGPRSADASPPATSMGAFVDRQFADFTAAAAPTAARSAWLADLASGAKTPVDLVDASEQSAYWQKQSPIIRLFQAYFLRLPDKSGLAYWVGQYRNGKKLSDISQKFATSSEFVRRYGTLTNRKFVEQVYLNVLGRAGEASGIAYWTGRLDSGAANRGQVMVGFSESSEYTRKTREQVWTVNFVTAMLLRIPTTAEVDTWKPQTRGALIVFLLGSSGYVARLGVVAPAAPPGILTTSLPGGTVGIGYAATLQSTGGVGAKVWQVASGVLPQGLAIVDDQILGQPERGGTSTFGLRVTDGNGRQSTRTFTITVPALAVTTSSLPDGTLNQVYASTQLATANAFGSVTWSVTGGALPTGMTLSSGGVIGGTPTSGGAFSVTVRATDAGASTANRTLAFTVSNFAITTTATPGGYVGIPYAFSLGAAGGSSYTWSLNGGSLPSGLGLSAAGVITGTPGAAGSSTFTVKVDAPGPKTASKQFTIAVTAVADWPQAGHDETRRAWNPGDGALDSTTVSGLGEEWNVRSAIEPSIVGNSVYGAGEVPGFSGTYAPMALDLSSGDLTWKGPSLPAGCQGGPVAVTATAVIVQCNTLLAYDRSGSHDLLWDTADTDPGQYSQHLIVVGSTAVTWGADRIIAYRLSDGQRLWQSLLPSGTTSIRGVAASGSSVVATYDDRLRSLSAATGAQLWTRAAANPYEVLIADGFVYAMAGGGVSRYALVDGTPGWSVLADSGIYQLVGVDADTIYAFEARFSDFGQESAVLRALKTSDGSQRWEAQLGTRLQSAAITKDLVWVMESQIYAWGRDSNLIAFRRTDGAERKRVHFDDNSYGPAAWGNGHVVLSQGGSFGGPDPYRLRAYGLAPPAPVITTKMVPTGRLGAPYSAALEATGGSGALTWSLASGTLPAGLGLSSAGVISGTPSGAGSVRVVVRVTDAKGRSRSRSLYLQVLGAATNAWSTEGGGSTRAGFNAAETAITRDTAGQIAFRWKTATPAGTEQSITADHLPVVVGTRTYDADKIGRLAAYDTTGTTANRAPAWTLTALDGTYYPDAPTEAGGTLYLFDSQRNLDAVRASDGVRLWHVGGGPNQYLRSEILVVGTLVLFLDSSYDLVARNTSDGSPAWSGAAVTLDGNELYGSPVLASDGTRVFVVANCEVKAITVATGAVAWTVPVKAGATSCPGAGSRMTPMVADGAVFANTYDGSIAIEAASGVVRWRAGAHGGLANGGGAISNGVWVLGNGSVDDPWMAALDLATGAILWENRSTIASASIGISGDLVVAANTYGLRGYDLLTGEQLFDGGVPDASSYTYGSVAIAAGKIFVATRDGIKAYGPP